MIEVVLTEAPYLCNPICSVTSIVCQLLLPEVEFLSLSLAAHHIECDSCG